MWYSVIASEWSSKKLTSLPPGKNRHISLAKRIRKLAEFTGVEYKSPHKFRHGHAVYALLHANNIADYKAISQNLMHGSIQVTDSIYAWLNNDQVKNRIAKLSHAKSNQREIHSELDDYVNNLSTRELQLMIQQAVDILAN